MNKKIKVIIRFEMDTLEIVMREQMEVVDKFFLGNISSQTIFIKIVALLIFS